MFSELRPPDLISILKGVTTYSQQVGSKKQKRKEIEYENKENAVNFLGTVSPASNTRPVHYG